MAFPHDVSRQHVTAASLEGDMQRVVFISTTYIAVWSYICCWAVVTDLHIIMNWLMQHNLSVHPLSGGSTVLTAVTNSWCAAIARDELGI